MAYQDLADRLENFAAEIIKLYEKMPHSYAAQYLAQQLIRSACSSALNYGEALGAGTTKDRVNKLRITLKELRESLRNLRIQNKANLLTLEKSKTLQSENDELIRIVVTLIKNSND
ncbi:four helix bundle protein [Nonlabens ulvanivorans]|uniref:four helix bundle protein n=1 Tax=Nonlabens ulvanivorans TaxID=906888 RepID=UPI002943DA07|nr:four helix bundle protein [Nonlabens ulvanivorans]WOI23012.1 four helix bundle protein [Nonlabens ulvanivorans]